MTRLIRFALNVSASCFFGYMASRVVGHVASSASVEASLIGFIGYMGVLTVDLVYVLIQQHYGLKHDEDQPRCNCGRLP